MARAAWNVGAFATLWAAMQFIFSPLIGVASVVVSMLLAKPLVHRLGERHAALLGLACGICGFLDFGLAPLGGMFLVGIALVGLWGVANPSFQSLMSRRIDPTEQGQLQGALGSIRAVTGMLATLVFTQVFSGRASWRRAGAGVAGAASRAGAKLMLAPLFEGLVGNQPALNRSLR